LVRELNMNILARAIGGLAVAGLVGAAGVAPASAAPSAWWLLHHQYPHHFVHRGYYHPGVRYYAAPAPYYGPRNYYGRGYYYSYPTYDPGAAIASGFIGGIFGAIAGTALSHAGGGGHAWRCEHHYRSYQPSTNTYMGYDGVRHLCRL
jgi:hypothetical protein